MSRGVVFLKVANPLEERPGPTLLKQAHQFGRERLLSVGRHLVDGCARAAALLDIASVDLPDLEVAGSAFGRVSNRNEIADDGGELSVGHEELGHEVDAPAVGVAKLFHFGLARERDFELFVHLEGGEGGGGGRGGGGGGNDSVSRGWISQGPGLGRTHDGGLAGARELMCRSQGPYLFDVERRSLSKHDRTVLAKGDSEY